MRTWTRCAQTNRWAAIRKKKRSLFLLPPVSRETRIRASQLDSFAELCGEHNTINSSTVTVPASVIHTKHSVMTRFVASLSWGIANQLYARRVLLYRARVRMQAHSGTIPRRLSKKQTGGRCFTHPGTLWNNHAFLWHPFELFGIGRPEHSHVPKRFLLLPTDSIFGSTLSTHHLTPGQLIPVPDAATPWDVFWFSRRSSRRFESSSFCSALVLLLSSCYMFLFDFGVCLFFFPFHLTICAFVGNFLRNALNYSFQPCC